MEFQEEVSWEVAVAWGEAALFMLVGIFPQGKLLRERLVGKTRVSTAAAGLETHSVVVYLHLLSILSTLVSLGTFAGLGGFPKQDGQDS